MFYCTFLSLDREMGLKDGRTNKSTASRCRKKPETTPLKALTSFPRQSSWLRLIKIRNLLIKYFSVFLYSRNVAM